MLDTELTVSLPVVLRVGTRGLDFNGLVRAIESAAAEVRGQLLGQALRALERGAMQREPKRWVNRGQQTRRIRLSWGAVAVRRTRVRDRLTGKTYNLADRLLGWRPYVRRGLDVVRSACELAVSMPYRLARYWWQRLTGLRCSLMSFWRMVQRAGERRARFERDQVGEVRPGDRSPRAVRRVYLEADGVWIRRQKRRRWRGGSRVVRGSGATLPTPKMLMYVGASYSQLLETGRNRRNAVDKQVTVEIGALHSFGRQWAWQVSRRFDLSRSANLLFLSDGDDGLSQLPRRHFRRALVQLDRFHVHQQLGRAFGLKTPGYRAALSALCEEDLGRVHSLLALRGVGERRKVCQQVRTYLDRHRSVLWTHRQWEQRTTVYKMGSGVIEKTIETQINRRMKKQGMSWSPAGARRLAKLRVLSWDTDRWEAFWSRLANQTTTGE